MIGLRAGLSIWIATQPVDFRRGMDSLAMLVSEAFGADPFDGGLYVFRSKRRDRVKILTWDGSGLVLYYKRIEGQFTWPPIKEGVMSLSHAQLSVLLDGSDWKLCRCELWISRCELVDHYQESFVTHAELL
ncbi:IS66 family insertion sequence element accessory protein TnpB [Bradyrhizobium sp. 2S1]|uniref:IS66 family insertion sequence element accessory protein TnpB n=2 Tax=Bradyrhizobium sp. 2S1 TaxID=1404429 RepID=UPI001408527C|nr:IS66 family insertion sequence element accessory protein TnpB [Bradyrhizobium sp. 2S1]MCK7664565.1 IS66 family insertion sequence element accessory protein TnpB [Bradyrhizobium sp. 2S1]